MSGERLGLLEETAFEFGALSKLLRTVGVAGDGVQQAPDSQPHPADARLAVPQFGVEGDPVEARSRHSLSLLRQ